MRNIFMSLLFLFPATEQLRTTEAYPEIQSDFPLLWKANIGKASFRTNLSFTAEHLIVGSNGNSFLDYMFYDKRSGVYVLNRGSGNIVRKFADEALGDMDVNGVLIHNGKYYFGNDNEEFLCTNTNGKLLWRNLTSGDIESEPILLRRNDSYIVVYASESGEVTAVNPENGKLLWQYFTPDFSGFKPGDSRSIFKVKAFFSNSTSFYTKPFVIDLNKDGQSDLVYLTWDNTVTAIDGGKGKLLWRFVSDNLLGSDLLVSDGPAGPVIMVQDYVYRQGSGLRESRLLSLDSNGKLIEERKVGAYSHDAGLNHFTDKQDTLVMNINDSLLFIKNGKVCRALYYDSKPLQQEEEDWVEGVNHRDALFSQNSFSMKGHPRCVALLNQRDYLHMKYAVLEIVSLDDGSVLKRYSIPENSEMPPLIKDVNKDGFLDLLINAYDGSLYCYNMKIKS